MIVRLLRRWLVLPLFILTFTVTQLSSSITFAVVATTSPCAAGISALDCAAIINNWPNWVPDDGSSSCATSGLSSLAAGNANANLQLTANQVAVAKIIIGIAKTDNLNKQGALIGLMVGITESGLQIYSNSNVPLSLSNPNSQKVGSDHDSLGVFQQRISTNWSTISTDPNNQAAVNQLMDPAYNAEAFFGSPAGTNAPSALTKGLQNVTGWSTLDPWMAAQRTQISGYPDGSNYKKQLGTAQSIIDQYYDSSPAVPLPVAFTASSTSGAATPTSVCASAGGVVSGNVIQTAVNLAWDDVTFPNKGPADTPQCYNNGKAVIPTPADCHHGFQQLGNGDPTQYTTASYQAAWAKYNNAASTSFTDCGVYVATVMRASGADPNYKVSSTGAQLTYATNATKGDGTKMYTVTSNPTTANVQPGDILVNTEHTYMYVGLQADKFSVAEASQTNHSPEIDNVLYLGGFSLVHLNP
jgi:hypothetical protein